LAKVFQGPESSLRRMVVLGSIPLKTSLRGMFSYTVQQVGRSIYREKLENALPSGTVVHMQSWKALGIMDVNI